MRASRPWPWRCCRRPAARLRRPEPGEAAILDHVLRVLADLPPLLTYIVLGAGAAAENLVPPLPADTVVLFGAFLSAQGRASAWVVWLVTWLPNVASALTVYYLSRRYGRHFFQTRLGRLLLHPRQLRRVHGFYERWGVLAIFFSRFLPGFRAVVPLFAGISHVGVFRAGLPMLAASGLWYGLLVYLGHEAGLNWESLQALFANYTGWLVLVAGVLALALVVWWVRSRHRAARP